MTRRVLVSRKCTKKLDLSNKGTSGCQLFAPLTEPVMDGIERVWQDTLNSHRTKIICLLSHRGMDFTRPLKKDVSSRSFNYCKLYWPITSQRIWWPCQAYKHIVMFFKPSLSHIILLKEAFRICNFRPYQGIFFYCSVVQFLCLLYISIIWVWTQVTMDTLTGLQLRSSMNTKL